MDFKIFILLECLAFVIYLVLGMYKKLSFLLLFFSVPLFAQLSPSLRQTTKYSVRELEDWLRSQSRPNYVIPARYTIGGQISAKWKNIHETRGSQDQLGPGTGQSNNQYSIDTEIQFAYFFRQAFGDTRLSFRNSGGTFSGSSNAIELNRAYIGYHFITQGPHTLDVNVGRRDTRKLYNSMLMFKTRADGITGFVNYIWKNIVEYQATMGLYTSNPGSFWVARGRLFNIANLGFYFDYDYVWWAKNKPNRNTSNIQTKYGVSQFLVGWERKLSWLPSNLQFFAALLYNNRATRHPILKNQVLNVGGYAGAQYGTIKKKGDFSIQGQLQFCQLQAVPPWDMSGIGLGNTARSSFYRARTPEQLNDNTNFKGWEIKLNYALTDKVTLTSNFQRSVNLSDSVGLPASYTNFSLATAYSF